MDLDIWTEQDNAFKKFDRNKKKPKKKWVTTFSNFPNLFPSFQESCAIVSLANICLLHWCALWGKSGPGISPDQREKQHGCALGAGGRRPCDRGFLLAFECFKRGFQNLTFHLFVLIFSVYSIAIIVVTHTRTSDSVAVS